MSALLLLLALAAVVGAYALGRRHGGRAAVDQLWGPALALGAYGHALRETAKAEGLTVGELLERDGGPLPPLPPFE